jgi:hypothetical protein
MPSLPEPLHPSPSPSPVPPGRPTTAGGWRVLPSGRGQLVGRGDAARTRLMPTWGWVA